MKYRASADEEEEAELKFAAQGVPGSGAGLNRTSWSPDARFLACGLFLGGGRGGGLCFFFLLGHGSSSLSLHARVHAQTHSGRVREHI